MEADEYENFDEIANELDIDRDTYEPNPDDYYEQNRDIEGDCLHEDLVALFKKYVVAGKVSPIGYYHHSKDKFIDHSLCILKGLNENDYKPKSE